MTLVGGFRYPKHAVSAKYLFRIPHRVFFFLSLVPFLILFAAFDPREVQNKKHAQGVFFILVTPAGIEPTIPP